MSNKKSFDIAADNSALMQTVQQLTGEQQPAPAADPAPAKMKKSAKTASVYMTAEQHETIESIAAELGTNKHAVMQLAIRHFIQDYQSGKYKPTPLYKQVYY